MINNHLDAIVIGAGPAGVCASYYLKQYGMKHIVFEKGKIGESWRSQRWNSFRLNSPNRLTELPGNHYFRSEPENFSTASEYVSSLEAYTQKFDLPVLENSLVRSVEKLPGSEFFRVEILLANSITIFKSRCVIIASGCQSRMQMPMFAKNISPSIYQLHASQYKNANDLPDGNVLVIGSAQSGCQIAEDLADTGRKVILSTSMVARVPRRYRGKDIHDWLLDMKFFDMRKEQITDPALLNMKAPQLTGVGNHPKTISLQSLAKKGVHIIGKLKDAHKDVLLFETNAAGHVKFADTFSIRVKMMIDEHIIKKELIAPEPEHDEEDLPDENQNCVSEINSLDLGKQKISSIIWATGFSADLSYLKLPVFDSEGNVEQKDGITEIKGLFALGFHWLRNRKSSLLCGIYEDAEFIAKKVYEYHHSEKKEFAK